MQLKATHERTARAQASGSSDNSIRLWDVETATQRRAIENAHSSRIWELASDARGARLASASGDGSVKLWDLEAAGALRR